ncbi:MAG: phosphotransferase [Chloroflexi bacterium]|nr:phosphotransferase [Chloroflexota bacterium]MCY3938428.1 phosphotransferase [Chloroflexota bacterium]
MYDHDRIADLVCRLLPGAAVVGLRPVEPSTNRPPSVYKVTLGDGRAIAIKTASTSSSIDAAGNTIATEAAVLRRLGSLGCNTPRVVGLHASVGVLATEWLEGPTLERKLSADGPDAVDIEQVMREFLAIEICLDSARKRFDDARKKAARSSLLKESESTFQSVRSAARSVAAASGRSTSAAEDAANELRRQVCEGAWTVGSRDYNASNIVVCSKGPYFVDFSAIGADWPERRLVGYLIATGPGRKDGNFSTALDQRAGLIYERLGNTVWEGRPAGALLDAHFLTAVLYSIERLQIALTTPERPDSHTLLKAWPNPDERLSRLNELVHTRLYPNPTADRLRSALG